MFRKTAYASVDHNGSAASPRRTAIVFLIGTALLVLFLFANVGLGSVRISPGEVFSALFDSENASPDTLKILWNIRLPRMCSALILGGALALSGLLLQTYFSNPIAGPFILGIASGAKLAVAILLVFVVGTYRSVSSLTLVSAAFVGSMIVMAFVLLVSRKIKRASALIIGGVMVGYICSAVTDFIITFGSDASIVNLHNWSKGSFSGASWANVQFIAVSVSITFFIVLLMSKPIGALQLGENYAKSLGVNIRLLRIVLVVTSSFLSACVTAFAGPISFVGIAVPHVAKSALKTARPLLTVPLCFILGSVFCLGCDLVARTALSPSDLSISSVTAVFGAPIVLYMIVTRKRQQ